MSSGTRPKRSRDGSSSSEQPTSPPSPSKKKGSFSQHTTSKLDVSYLLNQDSESAAVMPHRGLSRAPPRASGPAKASSGSGGSSEGEEARTGPSPPGYYGHAKRAPPHQPRPGDASRDASRRGFPPPPYTSAPYQPPRSYPAAPVHYNPPVSSPALSPHRETPSAARPSLSTSSLPTSSPLASGPQAVRGREAAQGAGGPSGASGDRQHQCSKCDRVFKERGNLNKHYSSVHEGHRPFICNYPGCSKTFSFRDGLVRHQTTVHNNSRPFTCPVCSSTFKQQSHLNKHLRSNVHQ